VKANCIFAHCETTRTWITEGLHGSLEPWEVDGRWSEWKGGVVGLVRRYLAPQPIHIETVPEDPNEHLRLHRQSIRVHRCWRDYQSFCGTSQPSKTIRLEEEGVAMSGQRSPTLEDRGMLRRPTIDLWSPQVQAANVLMQAHNELGF